MNRPYPGLWTCPTWPPTGPNALTSSAPTPLRAMHWGSYRKQILGLLTLLLLASPNSQTLLAPTAAVAQVVPSLSTTSEPDASVPIDRNSARSTMLTFLKSINDVVRGEPDRIHDAVACLDLSEIPSLARDAKGQEYAIALKEIIDRTRYVEIDQISDGPNGPPYLFLLQKAGRVEIARTDSGEWLFTAETVSDIPRLLRAVEDMARVEGVLESPTAMSPALRLRQLVPDALRDRSFILQNWQWIFLFLLTFIGIVVDRIVVLVILRGLHNLLQRQGISLENDFLQSRLRPVGMLAMGMFWWWGIRLVGLPPTALSILLVAVKFVVTATAIWAAFRFIDLGAAWATRRAEKTKSKIDDVLVPMVRRAAKVFVSLVGLLFIADSLDLDVTGLVAGLGLGGLAFALAAQDTVKNLFGSVTVLTDRPFNIGDWVKLGSQEGTVVEVGFRSTRIRTFYDSIITVPNATLIDGVVDNMGSRTFRRWSTKLGVTYDTPPEKIEAFCEGIRELIRNHPYTRKDYFHVYANEFNAYSLDILLYVFHQAPDWQTELRERHRLFLDILRLARELGVEFAFPTQTLWLNRPEDAPSAPDLPLSPEMVEESVGVGRDHGRSIVEKLLGRNAPKPPPASGR